MMLCSRLRGNRSGLWYVSHVPKPTATSRVSVQVDDQGRSVIVASPGWTEREFEDAVPISLFVDTFDYSIDDDGTERWTVIWNPLRGVTPND